MVFGKEVTLQTHGQDKYGRTLADVLLPDGTNVNHELVREGWCWWYRKYAPGDTELAKLEQEARKRYTAEEIIGHLQTIEIETGKGLGIAELCRKLSITEQNCGKNCS